jgi:hypothetical protein
MGVRATHRSGITLGATPGIRPPDERMNSPLEDREVRLRGLALCPGGLSAVDARLPARKVARAVSAEADSVQL